MIKKLFAKIKKLFKNKYDNLTREEVVDAICRLEKEEMDLETGFVSKEETIKDLIEKGKRETSPDIRQLRAKQLMNKYAERKGDVQRAMLLLYNIKLLYKLKDAIDDKSFIVSIGNIPLNKLLADQKGLAKFLNNSLQTKIATEDILTSADETFNEVKEVYEPNEDIYGVGYTEDQILAMFENNDTILQEEDAEVQASIKNKD